MLKSKLEIKILNKKLWKKYFETKVPIDNKNL